MFPLIIVCMLFQAAVGDGGWEGSLLKKLLKELED